MNNDIPKELIQRKRMSDRKKGVPKTPEHRAAMSMAQKKLNGNVREFWKQHQDLSWSEAKKLYIETQRGK